MELARTLAELAPEESKPLFENRVAPKGYTKVIFRLMAIETARLHPRCHLQATWATRGKMIVAAWKALRGSGNTPTSIMFILGHRFATSRTQLEPLPPRFTNRFSRFLESNAESFLYAIADRRGWPVIESIRGLALRIPCGALVAQVDCRGPCTYCRRYVKRSRRTRSQSRIWATYRMCASAAD